MITEPSSLYEGWENNVFFLLLLFCLQSQWRIKYPQILPITLFLPCSAGALLLNWFNRSHWKQLDFFFQANDDFFTAVEFDMGAEYSVLIVRSSCYYLLDVNLMDEQQWVYLPEISNANEQLAVVLALASVINLIRPEFSAMFLDVLSLVLEGH